MLRTESSVTEDCVVHTYLLVAHNLTEDKSGYTTAFSRDLMPMLCRCNFCADNFICLSHSRFKATVQIEKAVRQQLK